MNLFRILILRDHVAWGSIYVDPSMSSPINAYIPRQRLFLQVEIRL